MNTFSLLALTKNAQLFIFQKYQNQAFHRDDTASSNSALWSKEAELRLPEAGAWREEGRSGLRLTWVARCAAGSCSAPSAPGSAGRLRHASPCFTGNPRSIWVSDKPLRNNKNSYLANGSSSRLGLAMAVHEDARSRATKVPGGGDRLLPLEEALSPCPFTFKSWLCSEMTPFHPSHEGRSPCPPCSALQSFLGTTGHSPKT